MSENLSETGCFYMGCSTVEDSYSELPHNTKAIEMQTSTQKWFYFLFQTNLDWSKNGANI